NGPSPTTWNAIETSPLRAYRVSGNTPLVSNTDTHSARSHHRSDTGDAGNGPRLARSLDLPDPRSHAPGTRPATQPGECPEAFLSQHSVHRRRRRRRRNSMGVG